MRCPKCHSETSNEALNCPSCNLVTPKGRLANPKKGTGKKVSSLEKRKVDFSSILPKMPSVRILVWAILLVVLGASGFLGYRYVYSDSDQMAPQTALNAMNQLRRLPSKEDGKNIDDYLNAEMKKSKEAGQLVSHQGWTIKPYDKESYLISFSFDEKNAKKSADWVVDPKNNIITPISELASTVQKEEKKD
jgi:hypothetical protein